MGLQDVPVAISSQQHTLRRTLVVGGVAQTEAWYLQGLPRIFVNAQQTVGAVAASVVVEWAIRDSSTPTVPEWLPLQTITLLPLPGNLPVNTLLTIGPVWLRFTLTGAAGDTAELACSAFV